MQKQHRSQVLSPGQIGENPGNEFGAKGAPEACLQDKINYLTDSFLTNLYMYQPEIKSVIFSIDQSKMSNITSRRFSWK